MTIMTCAIISKFCIKQEEDIPIYALNNTDLVTPGHTTDEEI